MQSEKQQKSLVLAANEDIRGHIGEGVVSYITETEKVWLKKTKQIRCPLLWLSSVLHETMNVGVACLFLSNKHTGCFFLAKWQQWEQRKHNTDPSLKRNANKNVFLKSYTSVLLPFNTWWLFPHQRRWVD